MARTLTEIYSEAKEVRSKYLGTSSIDNSSKMSIIDSITYITSSCIWAFENLLEVFQVDIANDLQNRVNGTPAYYSNALLKYQSGDELIINEEGTAFSYASVDESKRVVKRVSYSEFSDEGFYDKGLLLKVATGESGAFRRVDDNELLAIRSYINKVKFAGTKIHVVSRNGDVLIPRLTVYHDGAVSETEVYQNIENALNAFVANADFDGHVYEQRVIDAIQSAEHVVDVYIDRAASDQQGLFVAQYDDDNLLIPTQTGVDGQAISYEQRINRLFTPNSGFLKQSSKTGLESQLPLWRESIILKVEG